MRNLKTILFFGVIILFMSCRPDPEETIETCSSGAQGSISFNASNGESYNMIINEESFFMINQVTHPTEGSAVYITSGWYPDMTNTNFYSFSGLLMNAISTGTTMYDGSNEEEGLTLNHFENEVGFTYSSNEFTLNVSEANLCVGGTFCPIEATFSGEFTKTSFPSETTETVTVNGSFCLYKTL